MIAFEQIETLLSVREGLCGLKHSTPLAFSCVNATTGSLLFIRSSESVLYYFLCEVVLGLSGGGGDNDVAHTFAHILEWCLEGCHWLPLAPSVGSIEP